jgi:hypothetical protein
LIQLLPSRLNLGSLFERERKLRFRLSVEDGKLDLYAEPKRGKATRKEVT